MIISEFNIEYVDKKVIKRQVIAYQFMDTPMVDDCPLVLDFLDESIFFKVTPT